MRSMIQILLAAGLVSAVAIWATAPAADRGPRQGGGAAIEEWTTLDAVAGVGRIEWTCSDNGARVRFMARGAISERVTVRIGAFIKAHALLQRGYALDLPFNRSQTWTIRRLSESLPPVLVIKVLSKGTQECRPPEVEVHTRSG
jgi:hypothetical protein